MYKRESILVFFLISIAFSSFSQSSTSSPYSRFGVGDLRQSILPEQSALGGSYVAYSNEYSINFNNPATYSSLKPKSLLLSTSLASEGVHFSTIQLTQRTNNTYFNHISLAMPFNKYIFISSGLLPYSNMGYILDNTEEDPNFGAIDYNYTGEGGISNYYLGTAIKLNNILSLGVNASYLFGGLNRNKTVEFDDISIFNTNVENRTNVLGWSLNTGLLFHKRFEENKVLSIGATFQDNSDLKVRRTLLGRTYEINNSSIFFKDTFQNIIDTGSMVFPSKISAGICYSTNKWMLIANYSSQNWEDYQVKYNDEIETDSLENSICVSAGLQYTPEYNSITNYWKRINYRLGARFNRSYLTIIENPFLERSVTFGLGLPVKKSKTVYNLSIEIGERGVTDNDFYFFSTKTNYKLIKEQFIRFSIGVTFKGIWFVQRKYD